MTPLVATAALALAVTVLASASVVAAVGAAVPVVLGWSPLGFRVWRAGGTVSLRHALTDPATVRERLHRWMTLLALPGVFALVWAVLEASGASLPGARASGASAPWLAPSIALGALAAATIAVSGRVRRGLAVPTSVAWIPTVGAALAIAWITAGLADGRVTSDLQALVPLPTGIIVAGATVWMLGGLVVANDLRIVTTWDRLCRARHHHAKEDARV